jgi:hypothetical protein
LVRAPPPTFVAVCGHEQLPTIQLNLTTWNTIGCLCFDTANLCRTLTTWNYWTPVFDTGPVIEPEPDNLELLDAYVLIPDVAGGLTCQQFN